MKRWLGRLVIAIGLVVAALGIGATTEANTTNLTYDESAVARGGLDESADSDALEVQFSSMWERSAWPLATARSTSTTPSSRTPATEAGSTVNLSTAGRSAEEAAAINQYASRSNAWLAENGPQTIQSTDGALRAEASAAARAERLAAERAGTPYAGQAGHVPDTAITGQANPPGGWIDMPGYSNQVCGGVLGPRVGQVISGFTVDGAMPC